MTAGDRAGVPEPDLTLIVDGANVVGSRPDGWWRDRAGAAVRLYDELAGLAERGAAGIPAAQLATGEDGQAPASPEQAGTGQAGTFRAGHFFFFFFILAGGRLCKAAGTGGHRAGWHGQAGTGQAGTGQAGTGQAWHRAGWHRAGHSAGRPADRGGGPGPGRRGQGRRRPDKGPHGRGRPGTGPVILGRSRWCPRPAPATTRSSGWPGPGRGTASWSPPTGNCAAGPWPQAPRWPGRHGYGPSCDVDPRAAYGRCADPAHSMEESPAPRPPPKKLMVALIVLVVVLLAIAAVAADRSLKARKRLRRRRTSAARLATAIAGAEATEQERRAHQQASGALTSVMPAIHERSARRV